MSGNLPLDRTPGDNLHSFYRWGWLPLLGGSGAIALVVVILSEYVMDAVGVPAREPIVQFLVAGRAMFLSVLLAAWAGWYVLRSRRRIEAVREQLRAQQAALAEQAWRNEQMMGLGALSRAMAHEIRGPLHALALDCTLLRKRPDMAPRVCDAIEEQVTALDGLLQDYMAYSSLSGAQHRPQKVALPSVVSAALHGYGSQLSARQATLDVDVPPTLPTLSADPVGMRQLLNLLLRNAAESVQTGGAVRVKARSNEDDVVLSVAWDGPQIAQPEVLFRPFAGSGLALAIVKDVARAHGGEVHAQASGAGGLEISVRLPLELS